MRSEEGDEKPPLEVVREAICHSALGVIRKWEAEPEGQLVPR